MVLTAPGLMGEELTALVRRAGTTSDGAAWAAVEFQGISEEKSDRLQRVVKLELLATDAPAVLVVDGSAVRMQAVADQLASHGRRAHLANTSLMAIDWLGERGRRIALALIGDAISGATPSELLDYVGSEFPRVHRAALDCPPTEVLLRRLLDRVESEVALHAPWHLSELE